MSKIKLFSLIFILAMTVLVVSCSEKDQDILPAVVDTEIELDDFSDSDDPRRINNPKEDGASIQLQIDTAAYAHHFKDDYEDYFYYNEVYSKKSGFRLFVGKWECFNVVYNTSVTYNISTKHITVGADYRLNYNFYYSLEPAGAMKYSGIFSYVYDDHIPRVRHMTIHWTKGGF